MLESILGLAGAFAAIVFALAAVAVCAALFGALVTGILALAIKATD